MLLQELASKASDIHNILKKPKLTTTDMWSQYSPRLGQPSALTDKTDVPIKPIHLPLLPYYSNDNRLPATFRPYHNFPLETHCYTGDTQRQKATSNMQLSTVTQVLDNLGMLQRHIILYIARIDRINLLPSIVSAVTSSVMQPNGCIAPGIRPVFKPVTYYGVSNQGHFGMRSPMPQRRVAFGNMKKDSPVIAVRPFVQGKYLTIFSRLLACGGNLTFTEYCMSQLY